MSNSFLTAFKFTKENEGGYSNHKSDPGGKTLFGISIIYHPIWYAKVYSAWKSGNKDLLDKLLKDFYFQNYWQSEFDKLKDKILAIRLFDLSVNLGKKTAVRLLQQAIQDISNLTIEIDGIFGIKTLGACNSLFKSLNDEQPLYESFVGKAESYYKNRKNFNVFGKGWLNRLNKKIILLLLLAIFYGCSSKEIVRETIKIPSVDTVLVTDTIFTENPIIIGNKIDTVYKDTTIVKYYQKESKFIVEKTNSLEKQLSYLLMQNSNLILLVDSLKDKTKNIEKTINKKQDYPLISKLGWAFIGFICLFFIFLFLFLVRTKFKII